MITLLSFIFTLGILVIVHEFAHYRVAVACGVKVERFSVGFGRVLWRRQPTPGGTEFVLSALPLGGYVKWIDDREQPPITAEERPMMFSSRPLWQRAAIVAAGPVSNLLLAVLLYAAANWIGIDEPKALLATPTVNSLANRAGLHAGDLVTAIGVPDASQADPTWTDIRSMSDLQWEMTQAILRGEHLDLRVADAAGHGERTATLALDSIDPRDIESGLGQRVGIGMPYSDPVLGKITPNGPADRAGLHSGDRVLRVDGRAVADGAALRDLIRANALGAMQTWSVLREGRPLDIAVQPRITPDGTRNDGIHNIGRVDAVVGALPQMVMVRRGPVDGLVQGARRTWDVASMTVTMFGRMITGRASLRNLRGPITIAEVAGDAVRQGPAYYLGILALISVSLGVLNLLPLPMLDGGHLMYYIFEAATGRPVAGQWLRWLQGGGALVMLLLTSLALYNDVARLLGLH